jgi:hypothetical protein
MRPCHMSPGAKCWRLRPAAVLAFVAGLLAPPIVVAKISNVFPPQQLLAVGRSDVNGGASVERCNERFAELLQSKIDTCVAAGGNCYCRDAEGYPLYKKYYPARPPFGGVWVTTRRMTFQCRKATPPDTCAPCARVHP